MSGTHTQQQTHAVALILVKRSIRTMQDQEYQAITITCPGTPPPPKKNAAEMEKQRETETNDATTAAAPVSAASPASGASITFLVVLIIKTGSSDSFSHCYRCMHHLLPGQFSSVLLQCFTSSAIHAQMNMDSNYGNMIVAAEANKMMCCK